jgi:hypothetical protein
VTSTEVSDLRREVPVLKEVAAEQPLELLLRNKSMSADEA